MEVGIIDKISSLEKSFNSSMEGRLSLESIQRSSNNCVLDVKLASQNRQQLVDLDLYNDQDDEGEIMLLAMILLQLHGVKLPEDDNDLLNKKKRQRTSPDQLAILEQIFQTDKMPNQQTRVHLADQLGMSSRRVQIWFQNKRAKVKRSVSKPDGECSSPSSLNDLNESNSSISPPSSPSSSPSVPIDDESPINSPSLGVAVVPQMNTYKQPLLPLDAPIIISQTIINSLPSSTTTPSINVGTIIDNTTKQLKEQQLQFSRTSPFVDKQPLLTASY